MKKFFLIFSIVFITGSHLFAEINYNVVVRGDNDILTYKDSLSKQVPAPAVFNEKLEKFLVKKLLEGELDAVQMYTYLQTFRITTPDSNYVFVSEIDEGSRGLQFYVFYFNVKQNLCSDYFNIDGYFMKNDEEGFNEWNGKLIEKPYIKFADLKGDGSYVILFRRRAHNGTWNAVETIVIKPENDLNLKKMFSFYSKELKLLERESLIKREIKSLKGNDVTLSASVYDPGTDGFIRNMDDETLLISN